MVVELFSQKIGFMYMINNSKHILFLDQGDKALASTNNTEYVEAISDNSTPSLPMNTSPDAPSTNFSRDIQRGKYEPPVAESAKELHTCIDSTPTATDHRASLVRSSESVVGPTRNTRTPSDCLRLDHPIPSSRTRSEQRSNRGPGDDSPLMTLHHATSVTSH